MNKKTHAEITSTTTAEYGIIEFRSSLVKIITDNLRLSLLLILLCWTILPTFYFFWKYLEIKYNNYILTTQRMILKTGVFWKEINFIELYRVLDIKVERGLVYQMVDLMRSCVKQKPLLLGNIWLFTSDHSHRKLFIDAIPNSMQGKRI